MATYAHPSQKFSNIEKSLRLYVETNIYTAESIPVVWSGQSLDLTSEPFFVDVFTSLQKQTFVRSMNNTTDGWIKDLLLEFSIYVKMDHIKNTNAYKHLQIRDAIATYFEVSQNIPLYDFDNSKAAIYDAYVHDWVDDTNLVQNDELLHYVFSVLIRYHERRGA